jgi:hypothetical protein
METCKTCRWWVDSDRDEPYVNVKQCTCPKMVHGDHRTGGFPTDEPHALINEDTRHAIGGDEVGIVDGEGYYAAMFPAPDFGCIHHEAKG